MSEWQQITLANKNKVTCKQIDDGIEFRFTNNVDENLEHPTCIQDGRNTHIALSTDAIEAVIAHFMKINNMNIIELDGERLNMYFNNHKEPNTVD